MAASVRTVASLESAFQLTLGEAGAGAGARRQVCISKLQVAHAAVARELFRDKSTWRVTNFDPLVKLERADAILRLLQQLLLPALSANPTSPALLLSLARCCSKLTNCVAAVGGTFVPVGNNLVRSMRQVRDLCANGEHTLPQLAEAVNDLATRVAAVRSTDVQLRVRSTDGQLRD